MTLRQYFQGRPRGAQADLARQVGISRTWMSLLVSDRRLPSAELAVAIERCTGGKVRRKTLRPDLFGDLK